MNNEQATSGALTEVPGETPTFPRVPGETPRAFSAFMAWFLLGQARSLAAVADKLGESPGTVKNWSSKYDWAERLQTYQAGLLQEQARQHAASHLQQAEDWNRRLVALREQEWVAAQKLNTVAQCFLETCGDDEVRRMTLAQASRALQVSSAVARSAIIGAELPASAESGLSPLQQQLLAGLTRARSPLFARSGSFSISFSGHRRSRWVTLGHVGSRWVIFPKASRAMADFSLM